MAIIPSSPSTGACRQHRPAAAWALALLLGLPGCGGGGAGAETPAQALDWIASAAGLADTQADPGEAGSPPAAQRSSVVRLGLNLDPALPPNPTPLFDPADSRSYERRLTLPVYGTQGEEIALGLYLRRQATAGPAHSGVDRWHLFFSANQQLLAGAPVELVFGPDGRLSPESPRTALLNLPPLALAGAGIGVALTGLQVQLQGVSQHAAVPGLGRYELDAEADFPQIDGQAAAPALTLAANTRQDLAGLAR